MPSRHSTPLSVGLAVGRGTGPELAEVFEQVLQQLSRKYGVDVRIVRSPRLYHSYFSLKEHFSSDPAEVSKQSQLDVEHYLDWCTRVSSTAAEEDTSGRRADVIFRTAMNAQSLYLVRQSLEAVKLERFEQQRDEATGAVNEMLLVRDQAQGFYTGINRHDKATGTVTRDTTFGKQVMSRLLDYSLERACQLWGEGGVDKVLLVYKFHLFDGVLSAWADEWSAQRGGTPVEFVQPDTANRNLLAHGIRGRQLVLAGNEWADIMHVILLHMFGNTAQEERCTENVYLHPSVRGLVEYQTVHGSADDIAGQGLVNPSATMRAAAAILERHAGCVGAVDDMERAMKAVEDTGVGTGDQRRDRRVGTREMMETIMASHLPSSHKPQPRRANL